MFTQFVPFLSPCADVINDFMITQQFFSLSERTEFEEFTVEVFTGYLFPYTEVKIEHFEDTMIRYHFTGRLSNELC